MSIQAVNICRSTEDVAAALIGARHLRNISQDGLAARSGTHQSKVSEWETGTMGMTVRTLLKLLDALECDLAIIPRADDPDTDR